MLSAMRFTNVGVPPEIDGVPVAVSKAYIEFTARKNNGDTNFKNAALNLKITAQAADNPSTLWTSATTSPVGPDTAASVTWSVPGTAWTASGHTGRFRSHPDCAGIDKSARMAGAIRSCPLNRHLF